MDATERTQVLVVGTGAFDAIEFERRGLIIKRVSIEEAPAHFNSAKAVAVADAAGKFALIKKCLSDLFLQAEDHQLAQFVIVHSLADLAQVDALRTKEHRGSKARIVQTNELWLAAEPVARHSPGPPANDVTIEPGSIQLSEDAKILLRRAFFDCQRIFLEELSGGRESMSVYRVHAWLLPEWCIAGPRPLPFFVKMAEPEAIETEKTRYQVYAEHFIPFNFRPNIDHKRCVRTRSLAALAGDFVDDAVPLRKCLKLGLATGVLFALFETSLKGFRLQPIAAGQNPREGFLANFVTDRIKLDKILEQIISRARDFKLSMSPAEMLVILNQEAGKLCSLVGPCHGDLHSGNVMVRGGDAILIDFFSVGDGPLTADPAALEVSLMFGTDDEDKVDSIDEWRAFIDQIYDPRLQTLHPPALSEGKPGHFSWLRRSIRELRHILLGCNVDEREAKIVLAAYLIRYARLGKDALERGDTAAFDRHAYALVVAERIVAGLAGGGALKGSS
ncbi:MAG: hypothetical protein EPO07_05915 [Verrucomicrobia bacterium]|nr:MAG: hypothetical protein EPO07_05915 [Verrucomicrobiota bacterium]